MLFSRVYKVLDERADLMGRMLDVLGVRQAFTMDGKAASELRSACQNCVNCRNTKTCRSWLDEQEVIGQTSDPTFCPNYDRFLAWDPVHKSDR